MVFFSPYEIAMIREYLAPDYRAMYNHVAHDIAWFGGHIARHMLKEGLDGDDDDDFDTACQNIDRHVRASSYEAYEDVLRQLKSDTRSALRFDHHMHKISHGKFRIRMQ